MDRGRSKRLAGIGLAAACLLGVAPGLPAAAQNAPTAQPAPLERPYIALTVLRVADLDRAVDFYTRGLGMKEVGRFDTPGFTEVVVSYHDMSAGAGIGLMKSKDGTPIQQGNGLARININVPSVSAIEARLRDAGYERKEKPRERVPGSWLFFTQDLDGYPLGLVGPR